LGYDIFNTVMHAREIQAKNLAKYLNDLQDLTDLPIVIHGKAYKPDVDLLDGSYSLLIGSYLTEMGAKYTYSDPLTGDIVADGTTAIVLLAHNRHITYGYTGDTPEQQLYYQLGLSSVVVDPWRTFKTDTKSIKVLHYGNTRLLP
jgi:UDPglucose 6-dehydrogenase